MARRGELGFPVLGVARSGWTLERLVQRARESVARSVGSIDEAAFAQLAARLRFVGGNYEDAATYEDLRSALGNARNPAHYLAIPPSLAETLIESLAQSGCTRGARVILEKPLGATWCRRRR